MMPLEFCEANKPNFKTLGPRFKRHGVDFQEIQVFLLKNQSIESNGTLELVIAGKA
jgi:hypothetical protein